MITFNSNSIVVGYIKELLHTYNLPLPKVVDENIPLIDKQTYIKDTRIFQYINNKEKFVKVYVPGRALENMTTTMPIRGISYDSLTHEYLGNYLRFLRDYYSIDLMSMYNCYSNNFPSLLQVKINSNLFGSVLMDTTDSSYKIIMVPVKLGHNYTIAIDSLSGIDMFCGYYNKEYYNIENLSDLTYVKYGSTHFKQPIIYDLLSIYKYDAINHRPTDEINEIWKSKNISKYASVDKDLKLFIRIPFNNSSSITILEGDYLQDYIELNFKQPFKASLSEVTPNYKKTIIREEFDDKTQLLNKVEEDIDLSDKEFNNIRLNNRNKLLEVNTGVSYPISDRLIEYLMGNVIGPLDRIADNVKRIQSALVRNFNQGKALYQPIDYRNLEKDNKNSTIDGEDYNYYVSDNVGLEYNPKYYGKWLTQYRLLLYKLAQKNNVLANEDDLLGYVDKIIESQLGEEVDIYKEVE